MRTSLLTGLLVLLFLATTPGHAADRQPPHRFPTGSGGINAPGQTDKPYLVVVSLDGFRWDYPDLHSLPAIDRMIETGFRAERLRPVFPTLTFPNHYSIATGLYPDRHGLVGNRFPVPELGAWYELSNRETVEDGRFYSGEPIWVTAESQGMVSAAYFFVGTEASIHGIAPTHWRSYSKRVSGDERVDQVLAWLAEPAEKRPHLLMLYFEDVDDHSHWAGVGSESANAAIGRVDGYLQRLLGGIEDLPHGDRVNILVVSDHGQAGYRPDREALVLDEHVDLKGIRIVGEGSYAFLYFAEPDPERMQLVQSTINAAWGNGEALRPRQAPGGWRVGVNDRWPHLILVAEPGHAIVSTAARLGSLSAGTHGWSPDDEDMHGVLFGLGPQLASGARLGEVHSVDVYPLMLEILSLTGPPGTDGDLANVQAALAPRAVTR
jgi:predicted AlkP superfamily pyrophosphatase or phosphodiesterase